MKKIFLLSIITLLSVGVAKAAFTPDEMNDPSFMMNAGFSEMTAADVVIQQSRYNGVPAPNIEDKSYYNKPFIKAIRNVFIYLDPAMENNYRYHHDIKLTPVPYEL